MTGSAASSPAQARTPPLRRLLRYCQPHRGAIYAASLFSVLNKVFDLAPPLLIGAAVDVVVTQEDSLLASFGVVEPSTQLLLLGGLTLLIWGFESLFEYAYQWMWRTLAQTVEHEMRLDAYAHTQRLGLSYFEDRATGGLVTVLNDDVNQLERFLDGGASALIQLATTVLVIGAIFFVVAPEVAWIAAVPMPFVIWGSLRFQRRLAPRYQVVREQAGLLGSQLTTNVSGIATIQSYTAEAREIDRIAARSEGYREANRGAIALSSAFSPLIRMVIVVGFTAVLVVGGGLVIEGALAVGAYSVLVFMTQRLLWPLTRLGQTLDLYQRGMASTERILDLLDEPIPIPDGAGALPIGGVEGEVRFEGVHFAYPGREPTLRGLDLTIPAGTTGAVVGATGAGKTTLIKLLLRFYDPSAGTVSLDGRAVDTLRLADLRGAIGLVSQDVFLFHGTVRENIAYGDPDASLEQVRRAAELAEAHPFIAELPQGYDTLVGERGQKLSGGQRQRISIARAILKNAPVLVFDEATSSVDNETEAAIQRSLERLAEGRTVIVIAHRLSTVRHADRIFVLEAGLVRESGRHEELVEGAGLYAALWRVQTGERSAEQPVVS